MILSETDRVDYVKFEVEQEEFMKTARKLVKDEDLLAKIGKLLTDQRIRILASVEHGKYTLETWSGVGLSLSFSADNRDKVTWWLRCLVDAVEGEFP